MVKAVSEEVESQTSNEKRASPTPGGGRRIVIVEVSLDGGTAWESCEFVDHLLDRPNTAGKFWAWRLWKHEVRSVGCSLIFI